MHANYLTRLLGFIVGHYFTARISGNSVLIEIPFTHPDGDGVEIVAVRNLQEARDALGY